MRSKNIDRILTSLGSRLLLEPFRSFHNVSGHPIFTIVLLQDNAQIIHCLWISLGSSEVEQANGFPDVFLLFTNIVLGDGKVLFQTQSVILHRVIITV